MTSATHKNFQSILPLCEVSCTATILHIWHQNSIFDVHRVTMHFCSPSQPVLLRFLELSIKDLLRSFPPIHGLHKSIRNHVYPVFMDDELMESGRFRIPQNLASPSFGLQDLLRSNRFTSACLYVHWQTMKVPTVYFKPLHTVSNLFKLFHNVVLSSYTGSAVYLYKVSSE